jgi:hypothetical protein
MEGVPILAGEQFWWGIGPQECLLGFLAFLGICCIAYYYLADTPVRPRSRKINNGARSEAIIQDFERRYKQGKISLAQYEDVLKRYLDK